MAAILVTVGLAPYQFDRLLTAVIPLCAYHDVFAQTGVSAVIPPCPNAAHVPLDEFQRRLTEADIVIHPRRRHCSSRATRGPAPAGRTPLVPPRRGPGRQPDRLFAGRGGSRPRPRGLGHRPVGRSGSRPPPHGPPRAAAPPISDETLVTAMEALSSRLFTGRTSGS